MMVRQGWVPGRGLGALQRNVDDPTILEAPPLVKALTLYQYHWEEDKNWGVGFRTPREYDEDRMKWMDISTAKPDIQDD
jgi:hypothetical protein